MTRARNIKTSIGLCIYFAVLTILVPNQATAAKWEVVKNAPRKTVFSTTFSIDKDSIVYHGEYRSFWVKGTRPDSNPTLWHMTVSCDNRLMRINEELDYRNKDSSGHPKSRRNPDALPYSNVPPESNEAAIFELVCTYKRWIFF